jgi:hypothetical protein
VCVFHKKNFKDCVKNTSELCEWGTSISEPLRQVLVTGMGQEKFIKLLQFWDWTHFDDLVFIK